MSTELTEAILSASGASALIQKEIDPLILELYRRYSPLMRNIPSRRITTDTFYFDTRGNLPQGGFVSDGGARPVSTSSYTQTSFKIKLLQIVGGVTGFAEAVTGSFGSLSANEQVGAAKGLGFDCETALCWGNAGSTINGPYPQFDGF